MAKWRTAIALCLGLVWVAVPAPTFGATPGCTLTSHCYSVLQAGSTSTPLYTGMYGTWNRAAMSAGCTSSSHVWMNSEMWFVQRGATNYGWVETGHTAGWLNPAGSCDYFAFAAYNREDGGGYTERVFAELNHNDAVTDEFQISRSGTTNVFYVYWNGNRLTSSNVQFWSTRGFDLGGEVATALGTSGTFRMQARAINTSGTRVLLPTPQTSSVHDPPLLGSRPADSAWTWRVRFS